MGTIRGFRHWRGRLSLLPVIALCGLLVPPPAGASFPGANGKIAFASDCAIYVVNPDGSELRQVTRPRVGCDAVIGGPEVTADGGKIVFSRQFLDPRPSGQGDLFVVDLDTGAERQLTDTPASSESTPTWSPDGRQIAFVRHAPHGNLRSEGSVFLLDVRSATERQLTKSNLDAAPDWSPDGRLIVFSRDEDPHGALMTVDLSGAQRRLTGHAKGVRPRHPDWSPDGRRVVYEATTEPGSSGIFVISAEPQNRPGEMLTTGRDFDDRPHTPVWSPTGEQIAFSRGYIRRSIRVMDARGANERLVLAPPTGFGTVWDLDWQPMRSPIVETCRRVTRATPSISKAVKPPKQVPVPRGNACDAIGGVTEPANSLIHQLPFGRFLADALAEPEEAASDPVGTAEEAVEDVEETVGGLGFPALVPNARMKYRTVLRQADGRQIIKEHDAFIGHSTALNADNDVLRTPEAYAQLLPIDPLDPYRGARLCVAPIQVACGLSAPAAVQTARLQVEAIVDDPSSSRLAFGFDARGSGIPLAFDATLTDTGDEESRKRYNVLVRTTKKAASDELALIADLHNYGIEPPEPDQVCPGDEVKARQETTVARIAFAPVPPETEVGVTLCDPLGVDLRVTQPSRVTAEVDVSGPSATTRTIDAEMPVPGTTTTGEVLDRASFGAAYHAALEKLELYAATRLNDASFDYSSSDVAGRFGLHASATGLPAHVTLDLGEVEPGVLSADYDAGGDLTSLDLDVTDSRGLAGRANELHANLRDFPAHVDIRLGDEDGSVGGDAIDAHGGTVGLAEVQLIDGRSDEAAHELAAGNDGVLFRDTADVYALYARATDLRAMRLVRDGDPFGAACNTRGSAGDYLTDEGFTFCAEVNKAATHPLLIDMETPAVGYLRTALDALPAGLTTVKFGSEPIDRDDPSSPKRTRVSYRAASEADRLSLETNAGGTVGSLRVGLHPVPPRLEICQVGALACGPSWTSSDSLKNPVVSVNVQSRDAQGGFTPTTLSLDMREACPPSCLGEYTLIKSLTFSKLLLQASSDRDEFGCGDTPLFFYTDTDNLPVSGSGEIVDHCGDDSKITFKLPVGDPAKRDTVRAQDRMVVVNWAGGTAAEDGSMHCPSGTEILLKDQDLLSNDVDLQDELCTSGDALDFGG